MHFGQSVNCNIIHLLAISKYTEQVYYISAWSNVPLVSLLLPLAPRTTPRQGLFIPPEQSIVPLCSLQVFRVPHAPTTMSITDTE